jgi:hypothetical protein
LILKNQNRLIGNGYTIIDWFWFVPGFLNQVTGFLKKLYFGHFELIFAPHFLLFSSFSFLSTPVSRPWLSSSPFLLFCFPPFFLTRLHQLIHSFLSLFIYSFILFNVEVERLRERLNRLEREGEIERRQRAVTRGFETNKQI